MSGSIIYSYWGLNNPNFAIQIANGNYIVSDYDNNRIIELNSSLSYMTKIYPLAGVVFFDYLESSEILLVTSEILNKVYEITWSDIDYGSIMWQSNIYLNNPQCATYKQNDSDLIVIADTDNNRIVKYSKIINSYEFLEYYRLDQNDADTHHEMSRFNKPQVVFQYSDGNICVIEHEGKTLNFSTIESSSSSSVSSSTEIKTSSSSSSSSSTLP